MIALIDPRGNRGDELLHINETLAVGLNKLRREDRIRRDANGGRYRR